jgi:multiple sugar transport system substrate-binding protein
MPANRTLLVGVVLVAVICIAIFVIRPFNQQGPEQEGVVELLFWHTYSVHEANRARELFDEFEAQNPKIKVKMEYVPYHALRTKLLTYLAVGEAPADLIRLDIIYVPELANMSVLLPLDDYLDTLGVGAQDFYPGPWATVLWENHVWGLPLNTNTQVLFYRKDYFEAEGLSPPTTWEEFLEVARKLTKDLDGDGKIDRWGGTVGGDWSWHFDIWLWQNGGAELSPDMKRAVINETPGVEALTFLVDMIHKDKVVPPPEEWMMPYQGFALGYYSMIIEGPWAKELMMTVNSSVDTYMGVAPLPSGPVKEASIVGGEDLVIPKYVKNKEAVLKLVKFMMSEHFQLEMGKVGVLPTLKAAGENPYFTEDPYLSVFIRQMSTALPRAVHPAYGQMNDIIHNYLDAAFRLDMSPREALDTMAAEIDKLLGAEGHG